MEWQQGNFRVQRGVDFGGTVNTGEYHLTRMDVNRLLVLVPDQGAYGIELAQRVWALAAPCGLDVLFLSVPISGTAQEPALLLRLITLASQIRSDQVQADTCIEHGMSWAAAISRHWRPGDLVICCAEQTVHTRMRGMQPRWQVLQYSLGTPVFVLNGLYSDSNTEASHSLPMRVLMRWAIPVVMIAGFFFAQTRVDVLAAGLTHTLALIAIGLAEVGLLALWSLLT